MNNIKNFFGIFGIDDDILKKTELVENRCEFIFKEIDKIQDYNQQKILSSFIKHKVCLTDFSGSTGYGYSDQGRDKLDRVFADIFGSQDALVRHNFVCGTHAISTALFALLRPERKLLSITGLPYDTLSEVIGLKNSNINQGSLRDFGILYDQVDLRPDGDFDFDMINQKLKNNKNIDVVYIQKSRGYSLRPSLDINKIKKVIEFIKNINKQIVVMIDNCYGEFVERYEPTDVGADLIAGSLIKNPGGGIAKTGGYIAGRSDLIEKCAFRLTAPGLGKEVGCTFDELREMFLGLFLSPQAVSGALKTAVLAAGLFENIGFEVYPRFDEKRSDIIQAIKLGSEDKIIAFCEGLQKCSPIDSFVSPVPWEMPGYNNKIIMAAGAFTMGASIELSADAPIREPFAVFLQGGLTYAYGKLGIMSAVQYINKTNIRG